MLRPPIFDISPSKIEPAIYHFATRKVVSLPPAPPRHRIRIATQFSAARLRDPVVTAGEAIISGSAEPRLGGTWW
jgi:hypothetical protein